MQTGRLLIHFGQNEDGRESLEKRKRKLYFSPQTSVLGGSGARTSPFCLQAQGRPGRAPGNPHAADNLHQVCTGGASRETQTASLTLCFLLTFLQVQCAFEFGGNTEHMFSIHPHLNHQTVVVLWGQEERQASARPAPRTPAIRRERFSKRKSNFNSKGAAALSTLTGQADWDRGASPHCRGREGVHGPRARLLAQPFTEDLGGRGSKCERGSSHGLEQKEAVGGPLASLEGNADPVSPSDRG